MELKKRYNDLDDTLKHIRLQIEESIPFAQTFVPKFSNPQSLFIWLKPYLNYREDPRGVELLQSFPTLIQSNFYGIPGAGDCDCFTIAQTAACMVQDWNNCQLWIKLTGRSPFAARHIYGGVDINGKEIALDLTNKIPGKERYYPYIQKLYIKPL